MSAFRVLLSPRPKAAGGTEVPKAEAHASAGLVLGGCLNVPGADATPVPFPSPSPDSSNQKSVESVDTEVKRNDNEDACTTRGENGMDAFFMPHDGAEGELLAIRRYIASVSNMGQKSFQLTKTLGKGTFGRVRLASLMINHSVRYFALKMLQKKTIIRLKQVSHIINERLIHRAIYHPFIVNCYATFQDEKQLYFLMQYIAGGEFFSQMRKVQQFQNETARFYASEVFLALEYLHQQNVIYRDLKPENLLIAEDGHLKMTDFGFAKRIDDGRTYTLCGTNDYIAPEIIEGKGYGKSVDWWAFGVLLYEMFMGYPPFYHENPVNVYALISKGEIEWSNAVDPLGKDLISKLLVKDVSKRYGCGRGGATTIKDHNWFSNQANPILWDKVYAKDVQPPFVPLVVSPADTSHYNNYDESEDSIEKVLPQEQDPFKGF